MFGKGIFRRGVTVGEERGLSKAASWYQRKANAEARGEPFNEPPPWQRNGSSPSHYEENDKK